MSVKKVHDDQPKDFMFSEKNQKKLTKFSKDTLQKIKKVQ